MQEFFRRTWAQINLDAIENNILRIKSLLSPGALLCATVKADCYGHGYAFTAQAMCEAGADWFSVSNLAEALQLRRIGIDKPVLILGYTPPDKARELVYNDISQAVYSSDYAKALSQEAKKAGVTVNAHVKIDTGMSRIGFLYHDSVEDSGVIEEIAEICSLEGIRPEGVFTHFSSADTPDGELFTRLQYELFCTAVDSLKQIGTDFSIKHCSNSAAILNFPEMQFDMVRAGLILYGHYPSENVRKSIKLLPVMELKTVISMVKNIPAGTPVSYSGTFVSDREMTVATVPIGYADGYPRRASNKMYMLVNGKKAPITGNVCMDQTVLDVTGIPDVREGKQITVFGTDHGEYLGVEEIAKSSGLINYEILCGLSRRVPRVYIKDNEIIETTDYML
ncbi:MAG: alanine racemase [Ruminococcaceae bacterium]|nr:alanine racemase [Oscillospiraceae bacterium]